MRQVECLRLPPRTWRFLLGGSAIGDRATRGSMAVADDVPGQDVGRWRVRRRRVPVGAHRRRSARGWCCLALILAALPFFFRGEAEAKLSVEDYEIIGEALHATEMDEWPRAFRLMGSVEDPLATKLFHWISMIEGKGGSSFNVMSTFILKNPGWPRLDELQRLAEARLTDSADKRLTIDAVRASTSH